ncbi:MAG: glycosyl transferase [Bacteroidetes bacterium GWE2_39_28]|nr:MAG: glycosyl transferase [Bacteroidetes bacterium GWE2_39_28]OFY13636.1 MAG: glycosyl transferase [Bacteroidetes bacterium GWF2_39_10]OFZ07346.1 MAG: glycosyl transferase [Bacteroidetes bacterium RIFOXYB2_FULL_39_7]OFZ11775.1 MAG: glycosyl transferase [Bacteroidetes bacterium RIFOXYC2_FULL_39_11]
MTTLFWIALAIVFYTYAGYGFVLIFLVKIKEFFRAKVKISQTLTYKEVTLLIAAYNEEEIVDSKMRNTYEIDYPREKLKIVWVTDGSNDNTNNLLSKYSDVTVLYESKRAGKSAALNRAVPLLDTSIVIFTDANTMLNRESVREIVKAFSDPRVGCVAGEKRVQSGERDGASSAGEGIYWKYESMLKSLDSRLYSAVGAAGELFAIRTELFESVPADTLLDDFILSMKIAERGFKIHYCKEAYATESGSANMKEEEKRKVRISAGGIQSVLRLAPLLNIFKYHIFTFQYISHRVLRWTITPVLLFALFPMNLSIVLMGGSSVYTLFLVLQVLFYLGAIIGKIMADRKIKNKILYIPYYFLFMNLNVLGGIVYLIKRKRGDGTWEKSKRN